MDALLRYLRDGSVLQSDGGDCQAPLALIEGTPGTLGGAVVLMQVYRRLCEAIAAGRAQAKQVRVLAGSHKPALYRASADCPLSVVDCYSDPWGWNRSRSSSVDSGGMPVDCRTELLSLAAVERACSSQLEALPQRSVCLVIDCLGALLGVHSPQQVAGLLSRLTHLPAASCCVALCLGGDSDRGAALRALASAWVKTAEVPPLQAEGASAAVEAHCVLDVRLQRQTGRVFADQQLFTLLPDGEMHLSPVPQSPTAQQLAAAAITKSASATQEAEQLAEEMMRQMDGGMKLTLTDEERAAKEKVVLPYEHRGDRGLYNAADFTQYLPPAAGGVGAGSGKEKLGHILYVRDSDDEGEYDSDEDPDDDLDI